MAFDFIDIIIITALEASNCTQNNMFMSSSHELSQLLVM